MSYIDGIDHELVGIFTRLPVYHPLESIEGNPRESAYFNCTPTTLVIGGGNGEHPGLILHRPDVAVATFITAWIAQEQVNSLSAPSQASPALIDRWAPYLDQMDAVPDHEIWHFAGWDVPTYAQFYHTCQSETLWTPYDPNQAESFLWWLTTSFGEFVFYALPDLCPDVEAQLPGARQYIRDASYLNILIPPPGYPLPYGRKVVNGHVQWGNLRWP
jgi:hypothetical protein